MYDRILLPTDGSEGNDRAVGEAIDLAAETGAELHVLFVVEELPYAPEMTEDRLEVQLRGSARKRPRRSASAPRRRASRPRPQSRTERRIWRSWATSTER